MPTDRTLDLMPRRAVTDHLGLPVGLPLPGWTPPPYPERSIQCGQYCQLEPLTAAHAPGLFEANSRDARGTMWTYMPYGPFESFDAYCMWLEARAASVDPSCYAIIDRDTSQPVGVTSYMRIDRQNGTIELGGLAYSPLLQNTRASTEATFLMADRVFALGYRRLEWKCDSLNVASRRAARRFGMSLEGVFRHASVMKQRNRDTAWYSVTDDEWPALRACFVAWLRPENFDRFGVQRSRLSDATRPLLTRRESLAP